MSPGRKYWAFSTQTCVSGPAYNFQMVLHALKNEKLYKAKTLQEEL